MTNKNLIGYMPGDVVEFNIELEKFIKSCNNKGENIVKKYIKNNNLTKNSIEIYSSPTTLPKKFYHPLIPLGGKLSIKNIQENYNPVKIENQKVSIYKFTEIYPNKYKIQIVYLKNKPTLLNKIAKLKKLYLEKFFNYNNIPYENIKSYKIIEDPIAELKENQLKIRKKGKIIFKE